MGEDIKKNKQVKKNTKIELTEERVRQIAREEIRKYMGERAEQHLSIMLKD